MFLGLMIETILLGFSTVQVVQGKEWTPDKDEGGACRDDSCPVFASGIQNSLGLATVQGAEALGA
jgi:hypothetical protein